jgi:hypothetical protein
MTTLSEQYNTEPEEEAPAPTTTTTTDSILEPINAVTETVTETAQDAAETANDYAKYSYEATGDVVEKAQETVTSFMNSNVYVSRAGFLLLVLLGFAIVVKYGIQIITSMMNPTKIKVVDGMLNGNSGQIIYQDPSKSQSITLPRSNNAADGIEFTYAVWIYIQGTGSKNKLQHIFNKGNGSKSVAVNSGTEPELEYVINAPGVYLNLLQKTTEESYVAMKIIMNTFAKIDEMIEINNLPMNKWFHLVIRCDNNNFDVFINGNITESIELLGVPKQNYGNLNLGMDTGFDGYISDLIYCSYAMSTKEIIDTVKVGPNTKPSSLSPVSNVSNFFSNYLSTRWYFGGMGDMYNPKG